MELGVLSKARPISCSDSPAYQRLQTSRFSIAESPNRFPGLIQHHLSGADLHQMVLHRPIECTELRVPKCDIYGLSVYSVFFLVLVSSRPLMQTPSASLSALDLEGRSITAQRRSAPMAITTITHTPVRPTAITALTGLRASFSSAQVPGLVS